MGAVTRTVDAGMLPGKVGLMAKRFLQSVIVVACAAAFVYALAILGKSGTLQNVWAVLKAGHGGL